MTTTDLNTSQTVGQLVAQRPERGRVFERLGIDYCCGGRKPLAAACNERGLDIQQVVAELNAAEATPVASTDPDWTTVPLSLLADHIESVHHAFMRRELPRMASLVHKVASVHGAAHPDLKDLEQTYARFACDLNTHMSTEESALFPWIRSLEPGAAHEARPSAALDKPVRMMMQDHDDAGRALARMRELTNGFTPPDNACGTYRVMLSGLRDIETDLHTHVHKENNILFPRALELEASTRPSRGGGSCCTRSW